MSAIPVSTLGTPKVISSKPLENKDSKFVELRELTYIAANGTEVGMAIMGINLLFSKAREPDCPSQRRWEAVNRKTRAPDVEADAVDIFTHIKHPTKGPHTILVLQFRVSGEKAHAFWERIRRDS